MGNCFGKKKVKPITKNFFYEKRKSNERNLKDLNNYVDRKLQEVDIKIIEKYGLDNVKITLKTKWWLINTDIQSFNPLLIEINNKIFPNK
jgi:hypothetical protein